MLFKQSKLSNSLALMTLPASISLSAATIEPGDLIITEVMANPKAVSDANGEWFEIYNATSSTLNLANLNLSDDGSNNHTVASDPLNLAPNSFFVFGRNGNTTTNGGYTADYVYSGFTLSNDSDQIILSLGGIVIAQLAYTGGFVINGISSELKSLPSLVSNFGGTPEEASYLFGDGDYGTPGAMNSTDFTAVPLPAALPQLLLALGALFGIRIKQKR